MHYRIFCQKYVNSDHYLRAEFIEIFIWKRSQTAILVCQPLLLESGKSQDHNSCSLMDTLPRATHPSNHKWTEPTRIKLAALGCTTFLREPLSSWAFVRSRCPWATEMSPTCVCVQLKTSSVLWATDIAAWGVCVGERAICSRWSITVTCFDTSKLSELTHVRRLLCSGFEGPTRSQLLSRSHIFDCCK